MSAGTLLLVTEAIVVGAVLLYKSKLLTIFGWYNNFTSNSTVCKFASCYAGLHNKCLDVIYIHDVGICPNDDGDDSNDGSKYLIIDPVNSTVPDEHKKSE
jgi:hypothetical protein